MDLYAPLQRALAERNYEHPTPIQAKAIPPAIEGLDVLGCAQTGTGKTAAFALPILDYLGHEQPPVIPNRPKALVLAPTRELAIQIGDSFRSYGRHMQFSQSLVYGGVGHQKQIKSLRRGVDVLIATPGRLLDLIDQGHAQLEGIEFFVLDEADRMLDMGFMPALKRIISQLPKQRQSLFFSATLPPKIRGLASSLLFNPVSVTVNGTSTPVEKIEQSVRFVQRENKLAWLSGFLSSDEVERAIVFTRTKHGANGLAKKLNRAGSQATAIHGNKTQNARQRALDSFRRKDVKVLVATDVAARGIDIDGITHVINYDMPVDPESYVHRIGRTGRAGSEGIAISLCTHDELAELRAIEKLIGMNLRAEDPNDRIVAKDLATAKHGSRHKSNRRHRANKNKSKSQRVEQRGYSRRKNTARSPKANVRKRATVA